MQELRTKRKALVVGIPAGLGGAALFGSGVALGVWIERRGQEGPIERLAPRFRV